MKITFLHAPIGNGKVTAAIELPPKGYTGEAAVRYALAFCSPKDQFAKKKGRKIACGRLMKDGRFCGTVLVPAGQNVKECVYNALVQSEKMPRWAHKACF